MAKKCHLQQEHKKNICDFQTLHIVDIHDQSASEEPTARMIPFCGATVKRNQYQLPGRKVSVKGEGDTQ